MARKVIKRNAVLEALLKSRGMTAYKLSQALGLKDPYRAYKWVQGKSEPNAATMLRLTVVLGVSAEEILRVFGGETKDE